MHSFECILTVSENLENAQILQLQEGIDRAKNIVVLSGAGISVPSGIPDFRSANGLYSTKVGAYSAETIISHDFFFEHTDEFYAFYKNKMLYEHAKPNSMHKLLARLEERGKLSCIVTQNIDGLHQMAGSKNVCELHGTIHKNYCTRCHEFYDLNYIINSNGVPKCECGGMIKPDVVLYGEMLNNRVLAKSIGEISRADMFIVIGTSLVVYPAAGLVDYFDGDCKVVINKSATHYDNEADIVINDDCAHVADILTEMGI